MGGVRKLWHGAALFGVAVALCFALVPQRLASRSPQSPNATPSGVEEAVPAFHARAPQGEIPATMNPEFFTDPVVQNAYTVAARIKKTLYQQPCYCHCDRSQGHGSLLDCFASKHGADATCASTKISTPMNRSGKARLPRKFARASSGANGSRWMPANTRTRCRRTDAQVLRWT